MTTGIKSIDASNSALMVGTTEVMRLFPAGITIPGGMNVGFINGGQLAGLRNRIINGGFQIAQRGNETFTGTAGKYGGCDRVLTTMSATTVTGIALQSGEPIPNFSSTGFCHQMGNVQTTGTTVLAISMRLEAADVKDLSGRAVTMTVKLYHNAGFTVGVRPYIQKANAKDNFGTRTTVASGTQIMVPTATATLLTYSAVLGAVDAANGLDITWILEGLPALTTLTQFYWADQQFETGTSATPFEHRPVALELAMCQRYFRTARCGVFGYAAAGTVIFSDVTYPIQMRVAPAVTLSSYGNSNAANATVNYTDQAFTRFQTVIAGTGYGYSTFNVTFEAEL